MIVFLLQAEYSSNYLVVRDPIHVTD